MHILRPALTRVVTISHPSLRHLSPMAPLPNTISFHSLSHLTCREFTLSVSLIRRADSHTSQSEHHNFRSKGLTASLLRILSPFLLPLHTASSKALHRAQSGHAPRFPHTHTIELAAAGSEKASMQPHQHHQRRSSAAFGHLGPGRCSVSPGGQLLGLPRAPFPCHM